MVDRVTPHLPGTTPAGKPGGASGKAAAGKEQPLSFHEVLEQVQRPRVVVSAHARERMESRNIDLQEEDLRKITAAMEKARAKGARSRCSSTVKLPCWPA